MQWTGIRKNVGHQGIRKSSPRSLVNGGEELQSLAQARLRCCILEVERQAEESAKEAEEYRAARYRQILSEPSGEHPTPDDVEPSAADLVLRILQNAPAHSTLPAVRHIQIHLVLS